MIETALILLATAATSGIWMLPRRWHQHHALPSQPELSQPLSSLAPAGLFQLGKPSDTPTAHPFADLQLLHNGLLFYHATTRQPYFFDFAHIQWVSGVTLHTGNIMQVTLHLELDHRWRVLTMQLAEGDMALLLSVLRRIIAPSRLNIGNTLTPPIGPVPARIAGETLQGETTLGTDVGLYLLPHMLVVLKGDVVQARLDTSSIRRVLAVERTSGRILGLGNTEGIVRLYSMYDTVAFSLPQYRELAQEISHLSRCPVEFVMREDKVNKA